MRRILPLLCVFLSACTTIKIGEQDAFDTKRTVDLALIERLGGSLHQLRLERDGVELDAWHIVQPESEATVILYGGNGYLMVTARAQLQALLSLPLNVLTFDYRGYGKSTGEPSVAALAEDALFVRDYAVQELGVAPERLILHGHSLGSFVAMYVESSRDVAAVVLENPLTSVDDLVEGFVPWLFDPFVRFEVAPELQVHDNLERARVIERPLLVFSGTEDPIAPDRMAKALHEAAKGSTWISIEGGGHNDLPTAPDFGRAYAELLDELRAR